LESFHAINDHSLAAILAGLAANLRAEDAVQVAELFDSSRIERVGHGFNLTNRAAHFVWNLHKPRLAECYPCARDRRLVPRLTELTRRQEEIVKKFDLTKNQAACQMETAVADNQTNTENKTPNDEPKIKRHVVIRV
jgi:hypothetical protein